MRIRRVDPRSPDARWCVERYYEELDERFERGFDPDASIPADDEDLVHPRGAFLVATADGRPVGCGAVKAISEGTGSIKRMWVDSGARGMGVGRRILEALEEEARALGMTRLRLETNRTLREARALYASAGFREVAAFNDDPYADHWFEKELEPQG